MGQLPFTFSAKRRARAGAPKAKSKTPALRTQPTEPKKPAEPNDRLDPIKPIEPIEPIESVEPIQRAGPITQTKDVTKAPRTERSGRLQRTQGTVPTAGTAFTGETGQIALTDETERSGQIQPTEVTQPMEPAQRLSRSEQLRLEQGTGPESPTEPSRPAEQIDESLVLTVSDLQRRLRRDLQRRFHLVFVSGEISNMQVHGRSGHGYFTLKDRTAQLRCMIHRDVLNRQRFRPRDGIEVTVRGRMTVYERSGLMQLQADYLEPRGLGALQQEFLEHLEQLRNEGLTAVERKRNPPMFPRTIGVVTSMGGAALRDILRVALTRDPGLKVLLADAKVQGLGSAQSIADGIERLDATAEAEVIIVGRGGGSIEDLWAFNEERVARAIAECSVPVITGIGHETDTTIADLVADLRAPTPTGAAETAVARRSELIERWDGLSSRMRRAFKGHLAVQANALHELEARLVDPTAALSAKAQRLDELELRAERAIRQRLAEEHAFFESLDRRLQAQEASGQIEAWQVRLDMLRARLNHGIDRLVSRDQTRFAVAVGQLESLSPLGVLGRGYALVQKRSGQVVKRASDIQPGDDVQVTLSRGRFSARVLKTQERPNDD